MQAAVHTPAAPRTPATLSSVSVRGVSAVKEDVLENQFWVQKLFQTRTLFKSCYPQLAYYSFINTFVACQSRVIILHVVDSLTDSVRSVDEGGRGPTNVKRSPQPGR